MEASPRPDKDAAERVLAEHMAEMAKRNAEASAMVAPSISMPKIVSRRIELGTRKSVCDKHGDFVAYGHSFSATREIWSGCPECKREAEEAEIAQQLAAARQREAKVREEAIGAAAIPPRFVNRDFASFVADSPEKHRALSVARDYAEQFEAYAAKGKGLILSGLPGTGKSHLAAAIMLHVIGPRLWVQYVSCLAMIRAVRETWRKDSEKAERQILTQFGRDIDLLVVDEVGVQYGTDGEQTILFEILDRRYNEMRPTILLTNQDRDGFKSFVGDRVFDRLGETCTWVSFDWSSYRPIARREAA